MPAFVWYGVALAVVVGSLWCWWIDYKIRRDFEALQWALPARLYSRPLELYAGAHLSPEDLVDYLQRLGYRKSGKVADSGEYRQSGSQFQLQTRGFRFWDGTEQEVFADLTFDGHTISSMKGKGNEELALVRLEPVEIEQINPTTGEDRMPVGLSEVPPMLVKALVDVEDVRFYQHHGIDPRGIARMVWVNLKAMRIVQGGSTLTQQLIKNLYLSEAQTITRKAQEAVMALALEMHFSKEQILTAYINEVHLGQDGARAIHGFALASQFYFARPLQELRLDEIATLVGIAKGSSYYNPLKHADRARDRRNVVLARMHELGDITDKEFERASKAKLQLREKVMNQNGYPAFMELVYDNLRRDYDKAALQSEGLNIFTTLDITMQSKMEARLDDAVKRIDRKPNKASPLETAVVITDANTGEVRALAGGRQRGYSGFNRALHASRPIGSLVKPAVYLTALETKQFNLASVLSDREIVIPQPKGEDWKPQNYDHQINGDVYFFDALQRSLNLATVDLGLRIGVPKVKETLQRLGYTGDVQPYPSLLLGAVNMTPLEVAQMYQAFASNGFRSPIRAVEAVTTSDGKPLAFYGIENKQVASAEDLWLLEHALRGVFERGTAESVQAALAGHLPLAGKTGTTNDLRDSWFAGYGNDLVGVVWVGHDDNRETGLTGATGALQVWTTLMRAMDIQPRQTIEPAELKWEKIPAVAAQRGEQRDCSTTLRVPYLESSAPEVGQSCEVSDSFFGRIIDRFKKL